MPYGAPILVRENLASVHGVDSQMSGQGVGGFAGGRPPLHGKRGGNRGKRGKAKEHSNRSHQRAWASPQGTAAFKGSEAHGMGSGWWSWRSGKMGGSKPRRWSLTGKSRTYAGLSGQKRKTVEETPRHGCLSCPRAPENTNSFLIENSLMTPMAVPSGEAGLDSWCGSAAGYQFLDDQTASLANNLSFDGSNVGLLRRDDGGVSFQAEEPASELSESEDELLGGFHLYDAGNMAGDLPPDVQGLIKKQASHISELQRHIAALQSENAQLRKGRNRATVELLHMGDGACADVEVKRMGQAAEDPSCWLWAVIVAGTAVSGK